MDREVAPVWSPSKAAVHREAKRKPLFFTCLNPWPFVGVSVVSLLMSIVAGPPIHHDIGPRLPGSFYASPRPQALREDVMKISIIRDGRVLFRNSQGRPEELPGLIYDALRNGAEKKVYLAVDLRSKFGDTVAVVDQIGKAGIREICFLTEKANAQ